MVVEGGTVTLAVVVLVAAGGGAGGGGAVVVEEVVILSNAQYQYVRCYSSSSGIWLDIWYPYVGCLRHPRCTDRNGMPFCLFGKWGVKVTPIAK